MHNKDTYNGVSIDVSTMCWLLDSPSHLPLGPTHQVGIRALVLHPITGKMLVVQEKSGQAAAWKLWKMPTGLADPGEDIVDAAIREVKEETGLDCSFDHIVCFLQAHGATLGKLDMFLCVNQNYQQNMSQCFSREMKLSCVHKKKNC